MPRTIRTRIQSLPYCGTVALSARKVDQVLERQWYEHDPYVCVTVLVMNIHRCIYIVDVQHAH